MPDINPLLEALQLKNWYAVAGFLLALAIQAHRRYPWLGAKLWAKLPDGSKFLVPLAGGAVVAFAAAFNAGQPLIEALKAAAGGAVAIGFGAMGVAAGLKESPLPWGGGAGGKPKVNDDKTPPTGTKAVGPIVGALACLVLVGCGLFGSDTPDAEDACPGAAKVAAVDCPALAVSKCSGTTWEACPAREEVEAECDKRIEEEMAKCP